MKTADVVRFWGTFIALVVCSLVFERLGWFEPNAITATIFAAYAATVTIVTAIRERPL